MKMLLNKRMDLQHVTIFEDSYNFLEHVEDLEPRPDIIFLDIHVPPLDGFEMLAMLRGLEWTRQVPIVALTASVMNEEISRLRTAGFNGCLAKPLNLSAFPDMLNRILGGEVIWSIVEY